MNIDWTKATIKVTVQIQHTATTSAQEVDVPVEQFAAWIMDAHSRHVRAEMARKAVARREPQSPSSHAAQD
jgi:hypothetical protein